MQVINNLISNAIKSTPNVEVLTTHIQDQENTEGKPATAPITVRDNGIDISAHLQEGLFEKFTKLDSPHQWQYHSVFLLSASYHPQITKKIKICPIGGYLTEPLSEQGIEMLSRSARGEPCELEEKGY